MQEILDVLEDNLNLMQGQEGVDFTLGNVDDLDPSEWQVRHLHLTVCHFLAAQFRRNHGPGHVLAN